MEKKENVKKVVNPILARAASEVAFFMHVLIGCIPDEDSRECLSADWKKMTEVIKVYF